MRTIALLSQKGGSGKTMLAIHVACVAAESGERVLLVDVDPQSSTADWGAARKRAGITGSPTVEKASAATLSQVLTRAQQDHISLVVIDSPPHATAGIDVIAASADLLLIPCRASAFDLRAVASSVNIAKAARKPAAFILNAIDSRIAEVAEAPTVLSHYGLPLAPSIAQRVDFARAVASGQSATEFAPRAKASEEIRALWAWIQHELRSVK